MTCTQKMYNTGININTCTGIFVCEESCRKHLRFRSENCDFDEILVHKSFIFHKNKKITRYEIVVISKGQGTKENGQHKKERMHCKCNKIISILFLLYRSLQLNVFIFSNCRYFFVMKRSIKKKTQSSSKPTVP